MAAMKRAAPLTSKTVLMRLLRKWPLVAVCLWLWIVVFIRHAPPNMWPWLFHVGSIAFAVSATLTLLESVLWGREKK